MKWLSLYKMLNLHHKWGGKNHNRKQKLPANKIQSNSF